MKTCPFCAEQIQDAAIVCRFCGRDLPKEEPKPNYASSIRPKETPESKAKKSSRVNAVIGVLLVAVALVCYLFVTFSNSPRPAAPEPTHTPMIIPTAVKHELTYRLSGTATSASVTLTNPQGGTEQLSNRAVPNEITYPYFPSGEFAYLSVQNEGDEGTITCEILWNGVVVKKATSSGAYVIASCSGRTP